MALKYINKVSLWLLQLLNTSSIRFENFLKRPATHMPLLYWQLVTCQESLLRISSLQGGCSKTELNLSNHKFLLTQGHQVLQFSPLVGLLVEDEEAAGLAHALLRLCPRLHLPPHPGATFWEGGDTHPIEKWFVDI